MRVIEGTVDEIVQYQRQLGQISDLTATVEVADALDEEVWVDRKVTVARTAEGGLDGEDDDSFFIKRHVYGRATSAATARRVLDFLAAAAAKGTKIQLGGSERTKDGLSDYLMVHDNSSSRFGAIVYVKPSTGGLTLRLRPEDVADVEDERVKLRNVRSSQQYAVNCPLNDERAIELALELSDRALAKVRAVHE